MKRVADYYRRRRAEGRGALAATALIPLKILKAIRLKPAPEPGSVLTGFERYDLPLLASYSRSGTNWIRYIIESISGQPTPGQVRLVEEGDFIIDRAHQAYVVMERYPGVVLVLRDYRECLLRHHHRLWEEVDGVHAFLESSDVDQPPSWYIKNIQAFEAFGGPKLILYYEDLVEAPKHEILRVSEFLGFDPGRTEGFLDDLDARYWESVKAYTKGGHSSETTGTKDLRFHAKKNLSGPQMSEFDTYFKEHSPELFRKYLSRYQIEAKPSE